MLVMNVFKIRGWGGGWERNILYFNQSLHVYKVIKYRV
jgi:hypothetical protein